MKTYERMRTEALKVLSNNHSCNNFHTLSEAVAKAFEQIEPRQTLGGAVPRLHNQSPKLDNDEEQLLAEVYWDFFREGIITIKSNGMMKIDLLSFHVSERGRKRLSEAI